MDSACGAAVEVVVADALVVVGPFWQPTMESATARTKTTADTVRRARGTYQPPDPVFGSVW
jgi:hypothetical protein